MLLLQCSFIFSALSSTLTRQRAVSSHALTETKLESLHESFVKYFADSFEEVPLPTHISFVDSNGLPAALPKYLSGIYIKNGPGLFGTTSQRYSHVFDGLSKLTRYEIKDSKIHFSTRFLKTSMFSKMVDQRNPLLPPSVTIGPVIPPFTATQSLLGATLYANDNDNTVVHVAQVGKNGASDVIQSSVLSVRRPLGGRHGRTSARGIR
jgi:carotenoid cleavage dioxygenase-like enzyme